MRLIFECPKCGVNNSSEKWLEITQEHLGRTDNNFSIYYCPWCGEASSYEKIASDWNRKDF